MHKEIAFHTNNNFKIILVLLHFPAPLDQIEPSGPG